MLKMFKNQKGEGEITLFDEIGGFFGVTAKDFDDGLKGLKGVKTIRVRVNSPGGSVFEGLAMYNMLLNHKAEIITQVEGVAASAASLVTMAGNRIVMAESSWIMIHNPMAMAMGTATEMRETADLLDQHETTLRKIYTDRTGLTDEEVDEMMEAETWMNGEDAKAKGFADEVTENMRVAASAVNLEWFHAVPDELAEQVNREKTMAARSKVAKMSAHLARRPA